MADDMQTYNSIPHVGMMAVANDITRIEGEDYFVDTDTGNAGSIILEGTKNMDQIFTMENNTDVFTFTKDFSIVYFKVCGTVRMTGDVDCISSMVVEGKNVHLGETIFTPLDDPGSTLGISTLEQISTSSVSDNSLTIKYMPIAGDMIAVNIHAGDQIKFSMIVSKGNQERRDVTFQIMAFI